MTNSFHSNIISIYGDKGQKWLDSLPQTVEKIAQEFGLTDIQTGMKDVPLSFNYIFFAKYQGIDAVVKVSPKSSKREAEALKHFGGKGMVSLLAHNNITIIVERAIPGKILAKNKPKSIEIACGVMKKLHAASADFDRSYFMDIEEWLKPIDQDWNFREDILDKARDYKKELLPKYTKRILLHGDLHHDNILKTTSGYIAIDPKGVIGDPIYDTGNLIVDYEKDTKFIAGYFGFNLEDIRKCYFLRTVLAICWCLEDNISPEKFVKIIEKIS